MQRRLSETVYVKVGLIGHSTETMGTGEVSVDLDDPDVSQRFGVGIVRAFRGALDDAIVAARPTVTEVLVEQLHTLHDEDTGTES